MPTDPERARLAAEALTRAKADAWARGDRPLGVTGVASARSPGGLPPKGGLGGFPPSGGSPGGWPPGVGSTSRPRRDDPQPLTATVGALLSARGWRQRAAVGAVFGRWAEVVGPDLAAHTRPEAFLDDGELVIAADSAAWAAQVRLLAPELLRRLAAEVGAGTVCRVRVQGPSGRGGPGRGGSGRGGSGQGRAGRGK
ncbi:MAG TPA: DUF721 domain-containing protein [Trebonia sp.]